MGKRGSRSAFIALLCGFSLLSLVGPACTSQAAYPSKPIEMVVAFAAGGGVDTFTRAMAKYLTPELGQPINVTNKPGGNQIPAVLSVLSAQPDGHTLLSATASATSMIVTMKDIPFKLEDLAFGPMMATGANACVVSGKSPWTSLKDVAEAAKKDPGSFTWASLGSRSYATFTALLFLQAAGVDIAKTKPVAFDGGGPAVTAIAGGHVMFGTLGTGAVYPLMSSGDLKVLAVEGEKRLPSMPNVPTTTEAGYPAANILSWYAPVGSKSLPKGVMERFDKAAKKIVDDPGYAKDQYALGNIPKYMAAEQMGPFVTKEVDTFEKIAALLPPQK